MFQLFHLFLSFLIPSFCSAALPTLGNPPSLDLFSVSETDPATVQVETPSGNSLRVTCNSTLYGAGMNAQSCSSALAQCPTGDRQESWAYHSKLGPDPPPVDVALPFVLLSDDATCAVIPTTRPVTAIGHASAMNVSDAARAVLQQCVIRRRIGGFAEQIGGDNRVGVFLSLVDRHVTCTGPVNTPPSSCRYIMNEMDKNTDLERFGRRGQVDVALPLTLRAPDGKCQVVIDTATPQLTVTIEWAKIWIAIEVTVTLCVKHGKGGRSIARPDLPGGWLSISVMDEPAPSTVNAISAEHAPA